ncbi:hypothetical protein BOTBODRAFT_465630 [Botryobasidium botryosum FD-172 SS1]|uniref:Uncharacterized protein n=1 Tax=Botryobasidium botryosum (strain FD-172 SS1) TaxID=930990 RepID=A0A067MGS6_BOTB1|nr:hypothetical protein BOTBODRAFT_465630 [Botryobasidium botryosum FD-172 SS1]
MRIKELIARATQAEQALTQHIQQSAAATAVGAANGTANVGDGFSLQNAMGLVNDRAQYKAIQRVIKTLVNRADIPPTIHFRHIHLITLGKIHRIRQPYLACFQHNWVTNKFIVMHLKSPRKTTRRHRRAEQALEEELTAASSGLGAGHRALVQGAAVAVVRARTTENGPIDVASAVSVIASLLCPLTSPYATV